MAESAVEMGYGLLHELEKNCADAASVSDATLKMLIKDNQNTEYGQKYGFSHIGSVAEYKEQVPFTTYDDYAEYVSRMVEGEDDVLTSYPTSFFALTTGSVGVSKKIPVSERAAMMNIGYSALIHQTVYDQAAKRAGKSGYIDKKSLLLAVASETRTAKDVSVTNFSGNLALTLKDSIVDTLAVPPEVLYGNNNEDLMYLRALYGLKEREVSLIGAPFMSAVYDYFCYIEKNWGELCNDIEVGRLAQDKNLSDETREKLGAILKPDPERARELREIFEQGFEEPMATKIWKNLQYINAIGSGSFKTYTDLLRRFTGKLPLSLSVYASSEGLIATTIALESSDYVVIPDSGYYEFIPEKDMFLPGEEIRQKTLGLNDLVVGEKYELVITNLSGLYRYRIGDVVRVTGSYGTAPTICFAYRKSQLLNVAGEKTSEELLQYSVHELEREMDINVAEWSVYEDHSLSPGRYVVFLETYPEIEEKDRERCRDILESKLAKANDFYAQYITDGHLSQMKVVFVMPQTYMLYREMMAYKGAITNQMKPVHVIDNPIKERFFFGLLDH